MNNTNSIKVALSFFGITRSLKYTIDSINKQILNVFKDENIKFDIFLHTYTIKNSYVNKRTKEKKKDPMYFINPKIIKKSEKLSKYEEGCLSIPNLFAEVKRPSACEVQYLDYKGEKKILKATGLLATCIQHEIDHLKGILFIDYLSKLKRDIILKKLSKQKIEQKRLVI